MASPSTGLELARRSTDLVEVERDYANFLWLLRCYREALEAQAASLAAHPQFHEVLRIIERRPR